MASLHSESSQSIVCSCDLWALCRSVFVSLLVDGTIWRRSHILATTAWSSLHSSSWEVPAGGSSSASSCHTSSSISEASFLAETSTLDLLSCIRIVGKALILDCILRRIGELGKTWVLYIHLSVTGWSIPVCHYLGAHLTSELFSYLIVLHEVLRASTVWPQGCTRQWCLLLILGLHGSQRIGLSLLLENPIVLTIIVVTTVY